METHTHTQFFSWSFLLGVMIRIHMGEWGVHLRLIRMLPFANDCSHKWGYFIVMKKVAAFDSAPALSQTCHRRPGRRHSQFNVTIELQSLSNLPEVAGLVSRRTPPLFYSKAHGLPSVPSEWEPLGYQSATCLGGRQESPTEETSTGRAPFRHPVS